MAVTKTSKAFMERNNLSNEPLRTYIGDTGRSFMEMTIAPDVPTLSYLWGNRL